jgi:hypothetical protein
VLVQAGAGVAAALPDRDYSEAGARIVPDGAVLLAEADLVVMVTRPREQDVPSFRSGTAVVGMLQPLVNSELVDALADRRRHVVQPGRDPAHHPLTVDGRAVVAGNGVRLQGGADVGGDCCPSSSRC